MDFVLLQCQKCAKNFAGMQVWGIAANLKNRCVVSFSGPFTRNGICPVHHDQPSRKVGTHESYHPSISCAGCRLITVHLTPRSSSRCKKCAAPFTPLALAGASHWGASAADSVQSLKAAEVAVGVRMIVIVEVGVCMMLDYYWHQS